jgi:hypothetical protein
MPLDIQPVPTLESVFDKYATEARVLEQHGHAEQARTIISLIDDIRVAAADYLTWLSESDAALRSNHAPAWLRAKFAAWSREGNARIHRGQRQYRKVVVPQRQHLESLSA